MQERASIDAGLEHEGSWISMTPDGADGEGLATGAVVARDGESARLVNSLISALGMRAVLESSIRTD